MPHVNGRIKADLQLKAPPPKALEALASVALSDANTATWLVLLEKHYEKLDAL